jgi:hypothetical protein
MVRVIQVINCLLTEASDQGGYRGRWSRHSTLTAGRLPGGTPGLPERWFRLFHSAVSELTASTSPVHVPISLSI